MSELTIDVTEWLGGTADLEDLTFGSLLIREDTTGLALTEVQDAIAQATRQTIRVPAIHVARWLLAHWWRLRWEARSEPVTQAWRHAHSMAALGGGLAWPQLDIASDGEFVQLTVVGERDADVAAIRYLRDATVEIPAAEFERAVDRFVDRVENRISSVRPAERDLSELRAELRAERSDPEAVRRCRWEARAGFDPGDTPEGWRDAVQRVASEAGEIAIEDLIAVCGDGPSAAEAVAAMRRSTTTVDLGAVPTAAQEASGTRPWQRGVDAARVARDVLGIGYGPITDDTLTQLLGTKLPVAVDSVGETQVLGGYRAHDGGGVVRVLVSSPRLTNQRFYFARLIGMACQLPRAEQVLPITTVGTATQKVARAFAQEFLCPWAELDAFTAENGTGETTVARAAEHYGVSEMLITTTLVNRGKLNRARLAAYQI